MSFDELSPAQRRQAAEKKTRVRLLLLIAIAGVLFGTFWVKEKMGQRSAAKAARLNDPAHRARTALAEADAAVIAKDLDTVWIKLQRARQALDDGLIERPTDVNLLRSRVVVMRRLANVAEEQNRPDARALFNEALTHAQALFTQDPHTTRSRVDLLKAAREQGVHRMARNDPAGAAAALTAAAERIEEVHRVLPAKAKVLGLLASTWNDAAEAHGKAGDRAEAGRAVTRASAHAEAATQGGDDPVAGLASAAGLVGRAAQIAYTLQLPQALKLAEQSVALLEQQRALTPDNRSFDRSLAQWHGRVGELHLQAGRTAQAQASYAAAIATRRRLVERFKEDELRADLVRAINRLGAFHSAGERNAEAVKAYREAVALARELPRHRRVLLIALGNLAHVLGRIDKMVESKALAAEAYALALTRAEAEGASQKALLDAVIAGLRHARLLRAKPRPKRAEARRVAQAEKARLLGLTGKPGTTRTQALAGLDALLTELGARR